MTDGTTSSTRQASDADQPGAAQVRDLLQPAAPAGGGSYKFRSVTECTKRGIGPQDVVFELAERDALGLKPRVRHVLRERCLLIEPERLWLRSLARAAYRGTADGIKQPAASWLDTVVADSVRDLLGEDRHEEAQLLPLDDHTEYDYAMLTELLGIPQNRARLAAVRFNDLPPARRCIAFRAVVEGWPLDRCVEEQLGTRDHIEAELREALRLIACADPLSNEPRIVDEDGEPIL